MTSSRIDAGAQSRCGREARNEPMTDVDPSLVDDGLFMSSEEDLLVVNPGRFQSPGEQDPFPDSCTRRFEAIKPLTLRMESKC